METAADELVYVVLLGIITDRYPRAEMLNFHPSFVAVLVLVLKIVLMVPIEDMFIQAATVVVAVTAGV